MQKIEIVNIFFLFFKKTLAFFFMYGIVYTMLTYKCPRKTNKYGENNKNNKGKYDIGFLYGGIRK